jgi:hypothetical protein
VLHQVGLERRFLVRGDVVGQVELPGGERGQLLVPPGMAPIGIGG